MKLELMTCIILFAFAGAAQFINPTTTVIVETPARYQLMEGIDVAINNVQYSVNNFMLTRGGGEL